MTLNTILDAAIQEINENAMGHISDIYIKQGEPVYFYRLKQFVIPSDDFLPHLKEDGGVVTPEIYEAIKRECWKLNKEKAANDREKTQDRSYAFDYNDSWRIRVNVSRAYPDVPCMCFRLICRQVPELTELDLPETLTHLSLDNPRGLIVISGPTGSGKTTTLASLIQAICHHRSGHIATLEDPVEYVFSVEGRLITQQTVGTHIAGFREGINALLRDKVDTILVGELRDGESVQAAITASASHLVLATTHHGKAFRVLEYLVNKFPAAERDAALADLLECLLAISCQCLIPGKVDGVDRMVTAYDLLINTPEITKGFEKKNFNQLPTLMRAQKECVVWQDRLDRLYSRGVINFETYKAYADKDLGDLNDHAAQVRQNKP